jgi:hypothetical protein
LDNIDWATAKGIADEPTIDEFVRTVGGTRVDVLIPSPAFQNADYLFSQPRVIVELKIFETEFGKTREFQLKRDALIRRHVAENDLRGPLLGQPYPRQFLMDMLELFRPPLARITKKANRQVRETKTHLGIPDAGGVLICVNDNFRELNPVTIVGALSRILNGSCSSIDALVYLTNHYVDVPGSNYANLLWIPRYREKAPIALVEFVNWLGRQWGNFCETKMGPFDNRMEVASMPSFRGAKTIRRDRQ